MTRQRISQDLYPADRTLYSSCGGMHLTLCHHTQQDGDSKKSADRENTSAHKGIYAGGCREVVHTNLMKQPSPIVPVHRSTCMTCGSTLFRHCSGLSARGRHAHAGTRSSSELRFCSGAGA